MKLPSQRQYPKVISFNGETYQIKFVRKFKEKDQLGECDPGERIIRIKSGLDRAELFETVIHEVLHLIEFEYPVDLKHKHIYKISEALCQLLIENF